MKIVIQGELTDLNTYINGERRNRFIGAKIKKENTENVMWQVGGSEKITNYPIKIDFHWYTKDLKKDPDNISFAKKFILDGLVEKGVLENDTRKFIDGFSDSFYVDKINPRVELVIHN